jgi:curved DNA-binding protein CbpA
VANPQDLEKLCQGPKIWNAWREENPGRTPDLRDARLTLSQRQLGPSNGGPVDFQHTDLDGAEFRHATLIGADFQRANLVAADFVHARLDSANLAGADLTDAVLDYADLTGANLEGAILIGASFTNARGLTQEQIAAAYGNSSTVLPATLLPPEGWFPSLDDERFTGYPTPSLIFNRDPYEVLGVNRLATAEEIRTAFRNLVKKVHPDLNPGDAQAQETFKRVSIAYRILSNPDQRSRYDKGEIDADGEVSRDFEARRQFRRYAFRFYAAAAASLLLAIGALGTVWHTFLTQQDVAQSRVEIAVAAPPKRIERLAPPSIGMPAASESEDERAEGQGSLDGNADAATGEEASPVADAAGTVQETAERLDGDGGINLEAAATPSATIKQVAAEPSPDQHDNQTQQVAVAIAAGDAAKRAVTDRGEIAAVPGTTAGGHPSATQETLNPTGDAPASGPESEKLASLTEERNTQPLTNAFGEPPAITPAIPSGETSIAGAPPGELTLENAEPPAPPLSEEPVHTPALGDANRQEKAVESPRDASERGSVLDRGSLASAAPRQSPHGEILLPKANGRQLVKDPISELLWRRAIQEVLEKDAGQATASVESIPIPERFGERDEIWDRYSHSIPETDNDADRPWPEILTTKKKRVERTPEPPTSAAISVPTTHVTSREASPRTAVPAAPAAASLRKQAVSDILAGGM